MQILCDHEVASSHELRFYRETRWSALFCGLLLLAFVAAVMGFLTIAQAWSSPWALGGFAVWSAIMALPIHICLRTFRASRRPDAWLLAWASDRMYLRFRSFQNFRFDPETPSVVFIPRREMAWLRGHVRTLQTQDTEGYWNTPIKIKGFQVKLKKEVDTAPLSAALKEEAKRRDRKGIRFNHYPVTLDANGVLRVELRRPEALLTQLALSYPITVPDAVPLKDVRNMSRDEKEGHILDLVLAGQKIDAINAARELYGYELANAKRLDEGLVEN
jgi:hypothetical protein